MAKPRARTNLRGGGPPGVSQLNQKPEMNKKTAGQINQTMLEIDPRTIDFHDPSFMLKRNGNEVKRKTNSDLRKITSLSPNGFRDPQQQRNGVKKEQSAVTSPQNFASIVQNCVMQKGKPMPPKQQPMQIKTPSAYNQALQQQSYFHRKRKTMIDGNNHLHMEPEIRGAEEYSSRPMVLHQKQVSPPGSNQQATPMNFINNNFTPHANPKGRQGTFVKVIDGDPTSQGVDANGRISETLKEKIMLSNKNFDFKKLSKSIVLYH